MTDKITQPLIIPISESGNLYRLAQDYEIDLKHFGHDVRIFINKGFDYDGMSVNRWLWSLSGLSKDGMHRPATLIHDFLYVQKGYLTERPGSYLVDKTYVMDRESADKIFRDMLIELAIANHRVRLAYAAVRLFGWIYWNKK